MVAWRRQWQQPGVAPADPLMLEIGLGIPALMERLGLEPQASHHAGVHPAGMGCSPDGVKVFTGWSCPLMLTGTPDLFPAGPLLPHLPQVCSLSDLIWEMGTLNRPYSQVWMQSSAQGLAQSAQVSLVPQFLDCGKTSLFESNGTENRANPCDGMGWAAAYEQGRGHNPDFQLQRTYYVPGTVPATFHR